MENHLKHANVAIRFPRFVHRRCLDVRQILPYYWWSAPRRGYRWGWKPFIHIIHRPYYDYYTRYIQTYC
jgi:hypothetical protein